MQPCLSNGFLDKGSFHWSSNMIRYDIEETPYTLSPYGGVGGRGREAPPTRFEPAESRRSYSWRSATTGSTRVALSAGTRHAPSAAVSSANDVATYVRGSAGGPSYNMLARTRVVTSAAGIPTASPAAESSTPSPATSQRMSAERAPVAMRMPNSRVRAATPKEKTP